MRREKVEILIAGAGDRIIVPTAEESEAIDEQIASDPDDFELEEAWFEGAKPTKELLPEAYERAMRQSIRGIEPTGNNPSENARHFASVPKAWGSS